jgi:hypothetical protein
MRLVSSGRSASGQSSSADGEFVSTCPHETGPGSRSPELVAALLLEARAWWTPRRFDLMSAIPSPSGPVCQFGHDDRV